MLNANDLQLLSDYLDDALTTDQRVALEARLQTDPELRRELARLRATVELIGTLPTLTAPRSFALTPGMARRRPTILTSAAFSALSAAAAVVLLLIGAALFTIRTPAPSVALDQVAFAPTAQPTTSVDLRDTNIPASGSLSQPLLPMTATAVRDLSGAGAPPAVSNAFESTALKAATEPLADGLFLAVPTGTPAPVIAPELYAAAPSAAQSEANTTASSDVFGGAAAEEAPADSAQASQEAQQRLQTDQQAAPSQNSAAAQAPLPAATSAPSETPTGTPTAAPTSQPTETPTTFPSPTPLPTLASAPPVEVNASQDVNTVGIGLIAVALVLFGAAIVTTVLRRRR